MDNDTRGPAYRVMVADIEELIAALPQRRADEIIEEVFATNSDEGVAA